MTKEEKIQYLINLWVELGLVSLISDPEPDSESEVAAHD